MDTQLCSVMSSMAPLALNSHHEARTAISPVMSLRQVAWPCPSL